MENKTEKTDEKVKKHLFQKGDDPRRNLEGRPLGIKNFTTIFKDAIKKIAKSQDIKECDVEVDLVIKAIAKAGGGHYQFYKDIFDRVYGMPKQNIGLGVDETISEIKIEIKSNKEEVKNDSQPQSDNSI